jgi:hypothetical protein
LRASGVITSLSRRYQARIPNSAAYRIRGLPQGPGPSPGRCHLSQTARHADCPTRAPMPESGYLGVGTEGNGSSCARSSVQYPYR